MRYIYLDWNVIQYMKNSTVQGSINGPEFANLVRKLSKKYQFPFSEGHLRDLAESSKSHTNPYTNEDLEYLNKISDGFAIGIADENETLSTTNNVNIKELFNKILNETTSQPEFHISGGEYAVDYKKLPEGDIFRPYFEKNNGILNPKLMHLALKTLWENIDDPVFYKQFRSNVLNLKNTFKNTDTILDKKSDYFKRVIPLLDFICSNEPLKYVNNFEEVIQSFLSINERRLNEERIGQKIELAYMLIDFHPYFMDKVNKKNRPSNIARDCNNLFFASQAKYYVTEDKTAFRKADFVINALSLQVKVTNMSDFLAKFC